VEAGSVCMSLNKEKQGKNLFDLIDALIGIIRRIASFFELGQIFFFERPFYV
jgi:hypothetical protein